MTTTFHKIAHVAVEQNGIAIPVLRSLQNSNLSWDVRLRLDTDCGFKFVFENVKTERKYTIEFDPEQEMEILRFLRGEDVEPKPEPTPLLDLMQPASTDSDDAENPHPLFNQNQPERES